MLAASLAPEAKIHTSNRMFCDVELGEHFRILQDDKPRSEESSSSDEDFFECSESTTTSEPVENNKSESTPIQSPDDFKAFGMFRFSSSYHSRNPCRWSHIERGSTWEKH